MQGHCNFLAELFSKRCWRCIIGVFPWCVYVSNDIWVKRWGERRGRHEIWRRVLTFLEMLFGEPCREKPNGATTEINNIVSAVLKLL
jgi:hypothetical protein